MGVPNPNEADGTIAIPARQRHQAAWLARLAVLSALAAVVVLIVGSRNVIGLVLAVVIGLAAILAGTWWYLSNTGVVRLLAAFVVIAAPVALIVACIVHNRVGELVTAVALIALAASAGRAAIVWVRPATRMPERATPPPQQPFLIMNPRSGGGKVGKFDLVAKASGLGAKVQLLDGPGIVDVAELARRGMADGADLLGVAGGDGTQAIVAGLAADNDLPFMVLSAGTRNHFAMDLGLDRERPDAGLDALTDGAELSLDLGRINDRTFVNNASFGVYAEVVQSPAYRDDKAGTTLKMLPDLLNGRRGPKLIVRIDEMPPIEGPQAVLVSNNPYEAGDLAGLGRRARLDAGVLGVIVVTVDSAAAAVELLRGRQSTGVRRFLTRQVVIDADVGEIPVGVDGEALMLQTPVRCTIRPGALRVRVPKHRLQARPAAQFDVGDLLRVAVNRPPRDRSG
ncbi:MAG TPA: diacylglycerol kinase family protein [Jatrophihabitantaceae bacterium]|jgi:diacylglycerol kinase family enzyme